MASVVASGSGSLRQELRGAAQLRRTLKQAGDDLEDMKDAHIRAAKIVEEATLGLVPVDSGWLASTIRSSGTPTTATVRAGNKATPYAGPIHWGWPKRGIKSRPFLREAAQTIERDITDRYDRQVAEMLNKVVGR